MNTESKQLFHNYTLGMPFEDMKMKVLQEDIYDNKAVIAKEQMFNRGNYKFIAVGLDWGKNTLLPTRISNFSSKTLLKQETLSA